jgi:hypothetical protein
VSGRHAADHAARDTMLRVVAGAPSDEELAAVTAVLTALEAEAAVAARSTPRGAPRSAWSDRAARLRRPLDRGPGRWRGFTG